ncbi:branched-chain amino acid ABC transporter permease [Pararhizobium sp.]|uniref:branched-chain amino acid ABC transporter permease n=1 Tax=Pararhizobium sp. TaxID=1977563 RepID=UPI002725FAA8|nr:branched-chain amino acid ABC transporter permease LivH [Pararhizobium sp.]MDO9415032.1 branched-chain amino acid ABC transporter permease LivH [Pararhizobium sp.]
MNFEYFAQQVINGLTLGSIYGMIAIGYTMVYGIVGMINFAHGDIFMMGAFTAMIVFLILTALFTSVHVIFFIIVMMLVAMLLTGLWNWSIERVAYKPLRGSFRLAPLITAIGMSIFLSNFVQVTQGPRNKPIGTLIPQTYSFGQVTVSLKQIVVLVVTAVLLAIFWYLVNRTSLGRAQRACEQDRKMASLLGIDVDRTISITFVMGAALAAVAGTLYLTYYGVVLFTSGFVPGIKAFTAAVLGGIGSLPGAVLGGLMIGLIEALYAGYVSSDYKDVAVFSVLVVVLIFMPAGILGRPEVEKV